MVTHAQLDRYSKKTIRRGFLVGGLKLKITVSGIAITYDYCILCNMVNKSRLDDDNQFSYCTCTHDVVLAFAVRLKRHSSPNIVSSNHIADHGRKGQPSRLSGVLKSLLYKRRHATRRSLKELGN